uniref:DNA repair protein SWI5 like n=1 Tax=Talaromyces marneffei PM1 TaxID=1077442 RepID=A0A093XGP7_TALMA
MQQPQDQLPSSKDSDKDPQAEQHNDKTRGAFRSPTPSQTVRDHIRLLHDYNEIRDIGQGLLGLIAEKRGVRYKDVLEEFGVDADD